ncbi:arsenate reductase/protein-tyrosine-phosphatase family protein [Rhizobacter fulvus]
MSPGNARRVLLVGGDAPASLAACRWLGGAGHATALLRWSAQRSFADFSKHCSESVWLGAVDDGVELWLQRLSELLAVGRFLAIWPLDALAHELLCSGRWHPPTDVQLLGPPPLGYASATNRLTARELAAAFGLGTLPTTYLPRGAQPDAAIALPCIVRPERAAAIDADEPASYATRSIETHRALDDKLRDDLPRVGLLLQTPPQGRRLDLLLAAHDGELTFAAPARPELTEFARNLVGRLRWTGLLHVELFRHGSRTVFADLHCGPADVPDLACADGVRAVRAVLGGATTAPARAGCLDALPSLARAIGHLAHLASKLTMRARALAWRMHGGNASARQLRPSDAVLFVCKGNINRSLVAEQVLRHHGFKRVASAGLIGMSGRRASRAADSYVEETLGRPAGGLRSSSLRRAMARQPGFDAVVCFERRHVVELLGRHSELRGRVYLLTTLAGRPHGPIDIADPHGREDAEYRCCFERIATLLNRALNRAPAAQALAAHPR